MGLLMLKEIGKVKHLEKQKDLQMQMGFGMDWQTDLYLVILTQMDFDLEMHLVKR